MVTPVLDADAKTAFVIRHPIDVTELYSVDKTSQIAQLDEKARIAGKADSFSRAQMYEAMSRILNDERGHLRNLFNQARGFVAVLMGPKRVFEMANEAYYPLVGHRDIIGKPVWDALPELQGQGFDDASMRGVAIDVTERMRAEEKLREADKRKDEFLAMLAHELHMVPVDVKRCVTEAIEQVNPMLENKQHRISVHMPPGAKAQPLPNQAAPEAGAARPLNILMVDDNEDAAHMLALSLQAQGHDVAVEHHARSAIARAAMRGPMRICWTSDCPTWTATPWPATCVPRPPAPSCWR